MTIRLASPSGILLADYSPPGRFADSHWPLFMSICMRERHRFSRAGQDWDLWIDGNLTTYWRKEHRHDS